MSQDHNNKQVELSINTNLHDHAKSNKPKYISLPTRTVKMNKLVDLLAKNVLIVKIHLSNFSLKTKQTSSSFNNITYILTQHLALGADKFQGTISDISSE